MPGPETPIDPRSSGDAGRPTQESVFATVRTIVLELAPTRDRTLTDDARLLEDLQYHSLELVEMAFTLEDEFDLLPIDESVARTIRTIRDVQNHVFSEVAARLSDGHVKSS
jgi:acyl carrier protein